MFFKDDGLQKQSVDERIRLMKEGNKPSVKVDIEDDEGCCISLTEAEVVELFKAADYMATPKEMFTLFLWNIFKKKKRNKLIIELHRGRSWRSAFDVAKGNK